MSSDVCNFVTSGNISDINPLFYEELCDYLFNEDFIAAEYMKDGKLLRDEPLEKFRGEGGGQEFFSRPPPLQGFFRGQVTCTNIFFLFLGGGGGWGGYLLSQF